jgi:hypothetical protein
MCKSQGSAHSKVLVLSNADYQVPLQIIQKYSSLFTAGSFSADSILALNGLFAENSFKDYSIDISNVRNMFLFRDNLIKEMLPDVHLNLFIIGGLSEVILAQYYVFRKMLAPDDNIILYGEEYAKGINTFVTLLSDQEFDGKSHSFLKEHQGNGFATWTEINE